MVRGAWDKQRGGKPGQAGKGQHSREDFRAPACDGGEETGTKISGRVDSVAGVEAHGSANDQDHQAHSEGLQASGDRVVVGVHNGQHTHNERSCADELTSRENRVKSSPHPTFWSLLLASGFALALRVLLPPAFCSLRQ